MHFVKSTLLWSLQIVLSGAEWFSTNEFLYFYSPHEERYSYSEAINKCVDMGAHLTSVATEEEHRYLVTRMTKSNYWIGLWLEDASVDCNACSRLVSPGGSRPHTSSQCLQCRKKWIWRDGSAMLNGNNELALDMWWYDEPTGGQNCARLSTENGQFGFWKDTSCQTRFGFICKKVNDLTTTHSTRATTLPTAPTTHRTTVTTVTSTQSSTASPISTSQSHKREDEEDSTILRAALAGVLATAACLVLLLGVFLTTCYIYSQRSKRKRYEVEKARLQLQAISRHTSNWNIASNGPTTAIPADLHVQSHIHYPQSYNEYEQPVTVANSYSTSRTEPLTSFMARPPPLPTMPFEWSTPPGGRNKTPSANPTQAAVRCKAFPTAGCLVGSTTPDSTPRSVRNMPLSTLRSVRHTPPLMCSTPGSIRNEPVGFSADVSFDNTSHSVCSTPPSIRSAQDSAESTPRLPRDTPNPDYDPDSVMLNPKLRNEPIESNLPMFKEDLESVLKKRKNISETPFLPESSNLTFKSVESTPTSKIEQPVSNFSTFKSSSETLESASSTPLSVRKQSLDCTISELRSSQDNFADIFNAFDNIANDNFDDSFEVEATNGPYPDQYSVSSFEIAENGIIDSKSKRRKPGVFYVS